jgi:hypothetical protein
MGSGKRHFPEFQVRFVFSHVLPSKSQAKHENRVEGCIGILHPEVGLVLDLEELRGQK